MRAFRRAAITRWRGSLPPGLESGSFSQNYTIGYRESDGYRDHADSQRISLSGRWGLALGEDVAAGRHRPLLRWLKPRSRVT